MDSKQANFMYFKAIAGITFTVALMIAFINLISFENSNIQITEALNGVNSF